MGKPQEQPYVYQVGDVVVSNSQPDVAMTVESPEVSNRIHVIWFDRKDKLRRAEIPKACLHLHGEEDAPLSTKA